jgi:hypothetical protein
VLDRRQARYDEVAPDDTPNGNPWGQFIRETLAAGDAAAVGILINEGDYDTPLPEIVRLGSDETTVDTLTKLEDDVLYVFT